MKPDTIPELHVLDKDGSCIFTHGDRYEIPLYQRPYAWTEEHINQLIEDVKDIPEDGSQKYHLGSLVVYRKKDSLFEVIDGQQRLTTLYLLLTVLGIDLSYGENPTLAFSCRERSTYTLRHLRSLAESEEVEEEGKLERGITDGLSIVQQKIETDFPTVSELESFKEKLTRTCLYRIEVPADTDLNHYFEIMNTRGEQLEQHEVLKAWLMAPLSGKDAAKFASIWDKCSDMSCYVQTRFDVRTREVLFGWGFDHFPSSKQIESVAWGDWDDAESKGIREIVAKDVSSVVSRRGGDDEPSRFESVIDFKYFLIHALKVFVHVKGIESKTDGETLIPRLLDDKKLNATFERAIEEGLWDGASVDRARFSNEFIDCLLQTRFLFDKCIIKREFVGGDLEGRWSLKELFRGNNRSHQYRNTRFKRAKYQWSTTLAVTNQTVLMLESCLRVSYTSPKVMHWITELLCRLMEEPGLAEAEGFARIAEECAKQPIREYLESGDYSQGVNTQHVVFNYLDYLLWNRDRRKYEDFVFEFRTSVEHWYPQHPSDDTFMSWGEVDRFGNLCLVQRNVNSKFSNLNPLAKKATYRDMIAKGSLKLREMAKLTNGGEEWKDGACQRHEEAMLRLLREACGVENLH